MEEGRDIGRILKVVEILTDCDQDVLQVKAEPLGRGASCHTGRRSCFYRRLEGERLVFVDDGRLFDPGRVYLPAHHPRTLRNLCGKRLVDLVVSGTLEAVMRTVALYSATEVHRARGTDLAARGLGLISIMLGGIDIAGARAMADMLGMRGQERLIQLCGVREVLQGMAILAARDPTMWVWARIAGDALDIGIVAAEHYAGNRSKARNKALALAVVGGITALDVMNARRLSRENREPWSPGIDFSARSGLPAASRARPPGKAGRRQQPVSRAGAVPLPRGVSAGRGDVGLHLLGLALDRLDPELDHVADRDHAREPAVGHHGQMADAMLRHQLHEFGLGVRWAGRS